VVVVVGNWIFRSLAFSRFSSLYLSTFSSHVSSLFSLMYKGTVDDVVQTLMSKDVVVVVVGPISVARSAKNASKSASIRAEGTLLFAVASFFGLVTSGFAVADSEFRVGAYPNNKDASPLEALTWSETKVAFCSLKRLLVIFALANKTNTKTSACICMDADKRGGAQPSKQA